MDCGCIMQTLHSHIIICCVCVSSSRRIYIFSQFMPGMFWCYLLVLCALFYKLEAFAHRWFRDWFSVETPVNDSSNGTFSSAAELSVTEN